MTRSRHIPDRSASTAEREALSESARLALAHIRARTRQGKFASGLYWMPASEWQAALEELRAAGQAIVWVYGTVRGRADDQRRLDPRRAPDGRARERDLCSRSERERGGLAARPHRLSV